MKIKKINCYISKNLKKYYFYNISVIFTDFKLIGKIDNNGKI